MNSQSALLLSDRDGSPLAPLVVNLPLPTECIVRVS